MELWKDIKGYEGFYQVSNLGRVRSLDRVQKNRDGKIRNLRGKLLLPFLNSRGYLRVQLKLNGAKKYWFVHRVVALHFVDNPCEEYIIVNHLDNNPLNNSASNLEWTTYLGNILHAIKQGRMERTKEWLQHLREANEKNGRSVVGTNIKTGETIRFVCLNDSRKAGFEPSCVCDCCNGKRKTHKGYEWRYAA